MELVSFGDWVRRRRMSLDFTQAALARQVGCAEVTIRKIERDERRPSHTMAERLANCLFIDDSQREPFMQMARGEYVAASPNPIKNNVTRLSLSAGFTEHKGERAHFVARERQLKLLQENLDIAVNGQGKMVFVAGEVGLGKTSLLVEFARESMDTRPDLIVAGGSCDVYTGQGDPLLPFKDIFRMLFGDIENAGIQELINRKLTTRLARSIPAFIQILMDKGPHLIGTLLPEAVLEASLAQSFPHDPKSTQMLHRLQGHRTRQAASEIQELRQDYLFNEISSTLKALAQQVPLVLMLDDLHWIDHSSAALLGYLAKRLMHSPILIIGSYRPEDLVEGRADEQGSQSWHPLQEVLSESQRLFGQNRIDLDFTDPGEELDFVNALLGSNQNVFGEAFRKQLTRLTEGHPLFVVELLRDMREQGHIIQREDGRWQEGELMSWESLPARVEGVIEKRIARLPTDLRELLSIASVQGETFFAEVIVQVAQSNLREIVHRLSVEADQQHRLIYAQGVKHAGIERLSQYRFRHHLFQRYIYERLSAAERMYLHEAVGNALEILLKGNTDIDEVPASQLARHFQEAHLNVKASQYLLLSGQKAVRILAFDEAIKFFIRGLSLLKTAGRTPEIYRLEYDLNLSLAQSLWNKGSVVEVGSTLQNAIEIARILGDPNALALAVLAYEDPRWRLNLDPDLSQEYLREALTALQEEENGLRVRLLVALSRSLISSDEQAELHMTVDQALRIARRIDDPLALCDVLRIKAQIDRRPETTTERLLVVDELIEVAESIGDQERLADGLSLSIYDLLELGQIEKVDQMIAVHRKIALETKQPFQLHIAAVFQTMRAILHGDFIAAEIHANEAAEISQQIGIAELDGILGFQMFTIRREQGRIHEIAPIVKLIAANNPETSAWQPGLALIYSILGQAKECQAIFEQLVSDGVAFVAQDSLWLATLTYLTEVCAYMGDVTRADTLYQLLLPYDGRSVVVGGATACLGAVARYLGILATTMSDWDSAERHFENALLLDARMQASLWIAHSQCDYAVMLLRRGRVQDRERVNILLNDASSAAQRMDMVDLVQKVSILLGKQVLLRE